MDEKIAEPSSMDGKETFDPGKEEDCGLLESGDPSSRDTVLPLTRPDGSEQSVTPQLQCETCVPSDTVCVAEDHRECTSSQENEEMQTVEENIEESEQNERLHEQNTAEESAPIIKTDMRNVGENMSVDTSSIDTEKSLPCESSADDSNDDTDNFLTVASRSLLQDDSVVEFSVNESPHRQTERICHDSPFSDTKPHMPSTNTCQERRPQEEEEEEDSTSSPSPNCSTSSSSSTERPSQQAELRVEGLLSSSAVSSDLLQRVEGLEEELELGTVDFCPAPKENLMRMVSSLLDECDSLKKKKARLEDELDRARADQSREANTSLVEALRKSLAQAEADQCCLEDRLQQAEQNYMTENVRVRTELTERLERVTRQFEAANRDKESMVVKYATSEREVIVARKQKEAMEKKMKDMEREREQILGKNKNLMSERTRIIQTLDTKVQKNNWYQREVERLKEEVNSRDVKAKWTQNKLKTEMDSHKETLSKLDRALTKITKHEEELRTIKEEAESIVRSVRSDENSRANMLDMQLKEEKARLIMERQVNENRGSVFSRVSEELEALKHKHATLLEEAVSLRTKVSSFEAEREESEKLFTSLRSEVTAARQKASDLNLQLSNSSHLQQQLSREREQVSTVSQEVEELRALTAELEGELVACRQKEAELLAFTQKLTDKNVQVQSQLSALQSKTQLLELEHGEMKTELDDLKLQRSKLKTELSKSAQAQCTQVEELTRQLGEKTEEARQLSTLVMDLENEMQVLNRKNHNALKDMMREMQKMRRRMELQEPGSSGGEGIGGAVEQGSGQSSQSATPHDALSQGSRASSSTSLNDCHTHHQPTTNGTALPHNNLTDGMGAPVSDPMVTQQLLVDRIVRLQRGAARRAEKIEFLEEHNTQLVAELKKKSRIIHHYIMKEEAGALANSASDSSKFSNDTQGKARTMSQAELMRHGGIMASVYGSSPRDGTMTLELSLEINRKLQAVLEDTLLKNITLKENLNTLGDEIAKISQQKQLATSHK